MKLPEKWAKSIAEAGKGFGARLDPASIRSACIILLLGILQIIWAVDHGEFIALRLLDGRDWAHTAGRLLQVTGVVCGVTAVVGFVTADKDKMVYAQLTLGMVQLFLLNLCLLLHVGMAVTGGLIPYVGTVLFLNAAERHRNLVESADKRSSAGTKIYTGSLLLLVLLLPLGFYLSRLLALYGHGFFAQKMMTVTGSVLFLVISIAAGAGFLWGDRTATRGILRLFTVLLCISYGIALFAAVHLYLSLDQIHMFLCVGILLVGIGTYVMGVLETSAL